MSFIVLLFES